jgi:hypothetical protein
VEPVVVGARDGGGEIRLQAIGTDLLAGVEAEDEQPPRGEEHREVDALAVHGLELRSGVPAARFGLVVGALLVRSPADSAPAPLLERSNRPGPEQDLRLQLDANVALELLHADGGGVAILGRDVALPQVGGLEHVHVGVGDHEVFEGHDGFPLREGAL